ncbi:hypothetical protein FACS1894206_08900 [Deltaproteobacteria bacterium]|nr:hypothetical protein FACS1894206_08900 [Deltaproteobacteria bacterium]
MKHYFCLSVLVLALALSSACAQAPSMRAASPKSPLAGRSFTLVGVNGQAISESGPPANSPEIAFDDDMRVTGRMCNRFTGQGRLDFAGRVLTARDVASTRMFCANDVLRQGEDILFQLFEYGAEAAYAGSMLTLKANGYMLEYQEK